MRDYELVVLVPQDGDGGKKVLEGVKAAIETSHGKLGKTLEWGAKPLYFPIKKAREALYFVFPITLPIDGALMLERTLRVNEGILRYMLVRKEAGIEVPEKPIATKKDGKEKPAEKVGVKKPKSGLKSKSKAKKRKKRGRAPRSRKK